MLVPEFDTKIDALLWGGTGYWGKSHYFLLELDLHVVTLSYSVPVFEVDHPLLVGRQKLLCASVAFPLLCKTCIVHKTMSLQRDGI